jgi:hypothetical protein
MSIHAGKSVGYNPRSKGVGGAYTPLEQPLNIDICHLQNSIFKSDEHIRLRYVTHEENVLSIGFERVFDSAVQHF